ncbi:YARHG domain-containing protein [Bacillus sp. AFS053548]|uniref:YARHG domain-containing protein n=1 Tax=Bacillus sp. AFS053548 TaxID=2033505 RepID=UPI0025706FB0|nr:YARHG domain-containing protein [Bacillus sp. AFS053548]
MAYCTKCGGNLEQGAIFCTNCGERTSNPEVTNQVETRSENRNLQESNYKNKYNRMKGILISIAVLIVLAVAIYLIYPKLTSKSQHSQHVANQVKKKDKAKKKEKVEETEKVSEKNPTNTQTIPSYINRLEQLKIYDGSKSLSVGSWDITQSDGVINLTANNISLQNLQLIFNLYDSGEISPIRDWAIKVANIADEIAMSKNTSWYIYVGDQCVAQYPHTLSNDDLMYYSGSCGVSIPVLEGNSKDDLAIVIHTMVYGDMSTANEFILPMSNIRKLTQDDIDYLTKDELGIARNEIYARHGYIFKTVKMRNYFLAQSWYSPNVNYNGTLSEIETYNVNLIKAREELLN